MGGARDDKMMVVDAKRAGKYGGKFDARGAVGAALRGGRVKMVTVERRNGGRLAVAAAAKGGMAQRSTG